jgi:hypothetical protein
LNSSWIEFGCLAPYIPWARFLPVLPQDCTRPASVAFSLHILFGFLGTFLYMLTSDVPLFCHTASSRPCNTRYFAGGLSGQEMSIITSFSSLSANVLATQVPLSNHRKLS